MAAAVVGRRRGSSSSQAWRAQRGRPGVEDDRFDFAFERNPLSTTNEFIESELTDGGSEFQRGCRGSKRLSCVNLERVEHMLDEWLVLDLCGNGHGGPDGVVRCTIWDFNFRLLQSAEGDRQERCVETPNETSSDTMQDIQDPDYCVES